MYIKDCLKDKKPKILYHSNPHSLNTGFGRVAKEMLRYLYNTGKYEVVELANGLTLDDQRLPTAPWRVIGTIPNTISDIQAISEDPHLSKIAYYGHFGIDKIVLDEKPDVYIGVEDIWAFDGLNKKIWWDKVSTMIWTTVDSLPVLKSAYEMSNHADKFLVWSTFAKKEMKTNGAKNVETLFGPLGDSKFYPMTSEYRKQLRSNFGISDEFIIGFVFRNQPRKSVPNLISGFSLFKKKNPKSNAKLLLHTSWDEGWDIKRLMADSGVNNSDVLTTYVCASCKKYSVEPFSSNKKDCPQCGSKQSMSTSNISVGVSEKQLNEIYNIMDVYCHPFNSGGQEIPIQEAKLAGLITLVTNYSCGEDYCTEDSGGIQMSWSPYFPEVNTSFIKATTNIDSICSGLEKVYAMSEDERVRIGDIARDFVINNLSINVVGKRMESFIDDLPKKNLSFEISDIKKNENFDPDYSLDTPSFVRNIFLGIMNDNVDEATVEGWVKKINGGMTRKSMHNALVNIARSFNETLEPYDVKKFIKESLKKKALIVCPKGDIYLNVCALPFIQSLIDSGYDVYISSTQDMSEFFYGMDISGFIPINQKMKATQELYEKGFDKVIDLNKENWSMIDYLQGDYED